MKLIILAGGSGTRLFPLSRQAYPKQFLRVGGQKSLLAQTISRFLGKVAARDMIIVTNKAYKFYVQAVLREEDALEASIILEPSARNTAPAIALACQYCREKLGTEDNEVLFVTPSDHIVKQITRFIDLVNRAERIAQSGKIVTLGVVPDRAETEYGYILAGEAYPLGGRVVQQFKEKPAEKVARAYLQAGNCYWNAGMFVFTLGTLQEELHKYGENIFNLVSRDYEYALDNFSSMPSIAFDYVVAEQSDKMIVLPLDVYWNDMGSWDAWSSFLEKDDANNIACGDTELVGCKNTMLLSNSRLVVGVGLEDLNIVETSDVVLVTKQKQSQQIQQALVNLQTKGRTELAENITTLRPWGSYTILHKGEGYKVKKIVVNPGGRLSMQLHNKRSEHWTVVSGVATVTCNGQVSCCHANESTFIPIGCKHRLENLTDKETVVIEVQVGEYVEEDDIARFDDAYGRVANRFGEVVDREEL